MARPSHRLDIIITPLDPEARPLQAFRDLVDQLAREGVVAPDGTPGPAAEHWMPGGFARLRLDLPDQLTLYANRQGGFRAYCPERDVLVTAAFAQALGTARRGGDYVMQCPACSQVHALSDVTGRPPFALARCALITADVVAPSLPPSTLHRLTTAVGPTRRVLSRG